MGMRVAMWSAAVLLASVGLAPLRPVYAEEPLPLPCWDDFSCQALMEGIYAGLRTASERMQSKRGTLRALEQLRRGVSRGHRVELPPATRQYVAKGNPRIGEVTLNARHPPMIANSTPHMHHVRTVGEDLDVHLHAFLALKRPPAGMKGPSALVVIIDTNGCLWLLTMDGHVLVRGFHLGHDEGTTVTRLVLSPSQETHFILTADDGGNARVHNIKIKAKRVKAEDLPEGPELPQEMQPVRQREPSIAPEIRASTDFSCSFSIPTRVDDSAPRELTALLAVERASSVYFVAGDAAGGVSVFHRNGTFVSRTIVTEDHGGVRGFAPGHSQRVLVWSSHHFGFFSILRLDLEAAPCSGWNAPIFDATVDISSRQGRVILALSDGDLLVFSTKSTSAPALTITTACDLSMKFPRVSTHPLELNIVRGHVMGLTAAASSHFKDEGDHFRELVLLNLHAMEQHPSSSGRASRVVTMQFNFEPQRPRRLHYYVRLTAGSERSSIHLALQMWNATGVELYDLKIRAPKAAADTAQDRANMLAKAPKVALFAAALTLVVAWNIHRILKQERMEVRRKEAAAKAAAEAAAESASAEAESKPADDDNGDAAAADGDQDEKAPG